MWYEILPCFGIFTGCFAMTGISCFVSKYFWNGTVQGRGMNTRDMRWYYYRDNYLTGRARKIQAGLEGLPLK